MTGINVLRTTADWEKQFGPARRPSVISIGNFDGLHLGHRKILRTVTERAVGDRALSAAITFDPHPLKFLRPAQAPRLLQTLDQKIAGFAGIGLEAALILTFDARLAALSPEEFVRDTLVKSLNVRAVLVGQSFRFGARQAGDAACLRELGARFNFDVETIGPVSVDGEVVSSSAVRAAVGEGRVAHAARLLGRPFSLTGAIQKGAGRGAAIVVPTLNLAPEQEQLPGPGVYATETLVAGRIYRSATNVGIRPTFDAGAISVESHLFDFSESIAAGRLEVRFWERLRDEIKFDGPAQLRKQIDADLLNARQYFARIDRSSPASGPS
jgi:riboflavin kinase/FMN adenylyltransferase